jgi:hypothetical protein
MQLATRQKYRMVTTQKTYLMVFWRNVRRIHTVGYNYVEISGTPGCRNPSRDYSQQYE